MNKVFAVYVGKDVDTVWATSKGAEQRAAELARAKTDTEVRTWVVNGIPKQEPLASGPSIDWDKGDPPAEQKA